MSEPTEEQELSPEEFEAACREVGQMVQDEFKRIVSEIEQAVMLATLYGKPA